LAAKIINEIDSYEPRYHFKIGIIFMLVLATIIFIFKNTNNNDFIPFVATFNYVEGINNDTEVKIAGIKIGNVSKVTTSSNYVVVKGLVDKNYDIPEDSIIKIKSNGIFGKKVLSIEPGFGDYLDKSNQKYVFEQTQDSYSIDMFLRYLNDLNE
jgi:phospholipid/cholesterol/gamma-HCH transport system substrate-binding protein